MSASNGTGHAIQRPERMFDGEARPAASQPGATPVLAYVLVTSGRDVHVVSASPDPDAIRTGASTLSLDALAALLERTAAALRNGGEGATIAAAPAGAGHDARGGAQSADRLRVGQLEIVPETRLVLRRGEPVPLSRIEFDLFLALVRREGRPATRLELVREVWGYGAAVTSRSVDTQIYNLRHKLEENPANPRHLLTVSGVGYRVAAD